MTGHLISFLATAICTYPAAADGPARLELSLTGVEGTWRTVGDGTVSWEARAEAVSAQFSPNGSYAGIASPLPDEAMDGLVDVEITVSADGEAQLTMSFSLDDAAVPSGPAWIADLPAGRPRRLAARLAPPRSRGAPLYLHLGARGKGPVTVSDLVAVREGVPGPIDASSLKAPLPPDWRPEGNLDATARQMGEATELRVEVSGVEFSVLPEVACRLGTLAPLKALVTNRGGREKRLLVSAECPDGLAFGAREFPLTRPGTDRAVLRLQGLLPGTYAAKIIVGCGEDSASLPVRATVARGYPAFGTTVTGENQVAGRWQLQEILVQASGESTLEELSAAVEPRLDASPAVPAIHFDGLPAPDVLRAFVESLKGRVGLYGPAWRPDRPFAGEDPQAAAEALLAVSRELFTVVRTTDLDAAVVSPVFDHSANHPDSPENRLLNTCLDLGMSDYFAAIAVAGPALPAGGVLGESENGRNLRDGSLFWTGLDTACYASGVDAAAEAHDLYVPFLTSDIGGPASVDERLDALKVAHAIAAAAYVGCTGATLKETAPPGELALMRPDGTLSAAGIAVKEMSRELAGARAIPRSWESKAIPGRIGEPIVVLPFLRDTEAILVLWNNTSVARRLTLTLRDVPYSEHTLTVSHADPFVSRTYQGHFRFSDQAIKARAKEVYVRSAPLEVVLIRYRFGVALPTWLASIEFTAKTRTKSGGPPGRDDRPWWKKLQDWADGKE